MVNMDRVSLGLSSMLLALGLGAHAAHAQQNLPIAAPAEEPLPRPCSSHVASWRSNLLSVAELPLQCLTVNLPRGRE
jgi:hypothetical protein